MLWVFCFLPLALARKENACNGVPGYILAKARRCL